MTTEVQGAQSLPQAPTHIQQGDKLARARQWAPAIEHYLLALDQDPDSNMTWRKLADAYEKHGDVDNAIQAYRRILESAPTQRQARRNLAKLLVREGRAAEGKPLWQAELDEGPDGLSWSQHTIHTELAKRDLTVAGAYAAVAAEIQWGTDSSETPTRIPDRYHPPNIAKLRHDADQFRYLQRQGILGDEYNEIIHRYEQLADHLKAIGPDARLPLESAETQSIKHIYNRIVYRPDVPRVAQALSHQWNPEDVETKYLSQPPGVVYVDDFLTAEALEGLRQFCLESTVWCGNRYGHGRLGAFFQDGFNCPLLLQIAEELRAALPGVIGDRYPVQQLWGFKCGPELPADVTTHADFAAVNVNFWITPDDANLDPGSGGLTVYDVDAPLSWDFDTYNGRSDVIRPYLARQESTSLTIPYRQNRAVIFNSDLFHATDRVHFTPGYENLRVNITMLFGQREDEIHHRELHHPDITEHPLGLTPPWRSRALRSSRRRR